MPISLRDQFPLRLLVGNDDLTFLLDDGATFSNVDPGGFEAASFNAPRDLPDVLRGQHVLLTSGLRTAWEGRVAQVQRSLGHRTQLMCEGYGALLKDQTASMVFVDRDLTRWQGPTIGRQSGVTALGAEQSVSVGADPNGGSPGLVFAGTGPWTTALRVEGYYDAGPANLLAKVYMRISANGRLSTSFDEILYCTANPDVTTTQLLSLNLAANTSSAQYTTVSPQTRYLFFSLFFTGSGGDASGSYTAFCQNVAAYGNHGLTGRGSDPVGFYPSDIFGWAVGQASGLQAGVIQVTDASGYIVPHYVQYVPVTVDQIVGDMATIQGWHWGVWDSLTPLTGSSLPRADFRPRPAPGAFTTSCRRSDCSTLDLREDLSQQFNTAVVNYTDASGVAQTVTVTADNPILDQGAIPSRTVVFQGGTMTSATALLFGAEALALTNIQGRAAGTAEVITAIDGGTRPAWTLRAGVDRIRIADVVSTDAFGSSNDFPITRVEATIGTSGFTTNVEVGSGANLIETLQARLAAATALAGQGGA